MIGLGKSFGVRQVFSNVSFEIKEGDRIALVGPNGAGKSTLLKCILGIEELDEGQVVMSPVASIGYLQQDVNLGDASLAEEIETAWEDVHALENKLQELTTYLETHEASESDLQRLDYLQNRLEWLGGYDYEQKTKRIVYGLGFTDEDLYKPANAFSGGQKTRINLAKALVRSPDFLFLDEPTNHLDMEMLEWLEGYLSSYRGGILIVSHDRYFMDRIVTGVVELDHHKATTYRGNYSRYVAQREERLKADTIADVGLEADMKKMSIQQETVEICEYFRLNPYQMTSVGTLLIFTQNGEALVQKLQEAGKQAAVIGHTTNRKERVLSGGSERRFLDRPQPDELARIYESFIEQDRKEGKV